MGFKDASDEGCWVNKNVCYFCRESFDREMRLY